ncbi:uncharacterized protein CLUP02_17234 [Colletotrichum lupini]|uniref:Uncharacterized protein n=1 Tax=Colletotrichum lupini TaxID=145971 RepID=A0A9Q8WA70_9PEZI|nr:uncharacterized protein CLUP02_17234 [Colletotrichum lupini]UQC75726.1 hypothetical protein CLUP02_17234 [Colletotrichum lupini]
MATVMEETREYWKDRACLLFCPECTFPLQVFVSRLEIQDPPLSLPPQTLVIPPCGAVYPSRLFSHPLVFLPHLSNSFSTLEYLYTQHASTYLTSFFPREPAVLTFVQEDPDIK